MTTFPEELGRVYIIWPFHLLFRVKLLPILHDRQEAENDMLQQSKRGGVPVGHPRQ